MIRKDDRGRGCASTPCRERPAVVASETGRSPNRGSFGADGVGGHVQFKAHEPWEGRRRLERATAGGESPVGGPDGRCAGA